jgi:hypothetical protein
MPIEEGQAADKGQKDKTMTHKTLHKKLKIEQHESN